jgi:flagellar basal body-associated protein FliL
MAFCGNCGLQLLPRASVCPRCGAATDPRLLMEESHPNDPTIALFPTLDTAPSQPGTQPPTIQATPVPPSSTQPTYISQPGASNPNTDHGANAPTYITPLPLLTPQAGERSSYPSYPSYPGYPPPASSGANYPPVSGANYPAQSAFPPGYPPSATGGGVYQPIEAAYAPKTKQRRSASSLVALTLFLVALLFAGGALGVFLAKREGILFNTATPTPSTAPSTAPTTTSTQAVTPTSTQGSTPTPSPTSVPLTQQAQTLLQNYYSDINNKDYQDAYAMLGSQMQAQQQSYTNYVNGFSNTQQDTITITNTTQQSDGTVRLDVTLNATQNDGTQQTFTGYYIIGQENGSLKILQGHLQ